MSSSTSVAEPGDPPAKMDSDPLAALQIKYDGLVAREKRHLKTIEELRLQQARDRRHIARLQAGLAASSQELEAVRHSWRFRIGSWLLAPTSVLRNWLRPRRALEPSAREVVGRRADVSSERPARVPFEELERRAAAEPTVENAFSYARAAFYERGHVEMARKALEAFRADQLSSGQRQLVEILDGLHRLATQPPAIPPRQPNANLVVDPACVLYCVHSATPYLTNGYSTRTHGVATGARMAGVQMVVAARPGFPWDTKAVVDVVQEGRRRCEVLEGVPYVFTPDLNLESMPLDHYIAAAADAFAREAIRQRASLVHAASNHITGLAALLAARRLGLPFVYEVRGLWEVTQASERQGWGASDRYALAVQLESLVARQADRVLAITPELKDELVARGVEPTRIALLPNCVDIDRFAPIEPDVALLRKLGLDPERPTIGFAGSVVAYEGLDLLVQALAMLASEQVPFNLLVVGDGVALPPLKEAVEAAGLDAFCRFTGRVPQEDVRDLMSCMDIMPCPRRASPVTEMVSPLKPLEAMAMGKAVVLSDVTPHLAFSGQGDEERARLFRKDDAHDLARVLRELIADAGQRERLGRAGRLWVAKERTWLQAGRTLARAYEDARRAAAADTAKEEEVRPARLLASMQVALVADRFTTDVLSPELRIHRPSPANWREVFADNPIDALLVESAWEGNGGTWRRQVGYYSEEEIRPLREMVEHCRARGIPTLFWNKEDPVHFARFEKTAAMFDHVFTTDAGCISRYLQTPGTAARTASSLPFFAQPRIHNPVPGQRPWVHDVCYAGSYYGQRYAGRSAQLDTMLEPAAQLGLTIYDRQHFNADSPYRFPESLSRFVRGGLDYADMVQAYKSHAVHLNVNSVDDSATMFSRRVMEIAASGTALLSTRGRGVDETMAGTVVTVDDAAQAEAFLRLWLSDERARHSAILPPLREVLRAHTAGHRLAQLFRTACLRVVAPALPAYALVCRSWDESVARDILGQTVRPALVVAGSITAPVPEAFPVVEAASETLLDLMTLHGCSWVGAWPVTGAAVDPARQEDLLAATAWGDADAVGIRTTGANMVGRGVAVPLVLRADNVPALGGLVGLQVVAKTGFDAVTAVESLALVEAPGWILQRWADAPADQAAASKDGRTILVAGHDLKFLRAVMAHWQREGHRVLVDEWSAHNKHDAETSEALLAQADIVFCEWALGNAAWYSRRKRPGQQLIVRLHSQELRSPLTEQIEDEAVDRFVFVAGHIMDAARRRFGWPAPKCTVVPNYAGDAFFGFALPEQAPRRIGLVGITPRMKRLDRALDLMQTLLAANAGFELVVKGKRPEEYAWMRARPDELAYYEAQYQRISADPSLAAAVRFEPFGEDMAGFYRSVGHVISVSDYESFHLTLADGAASGALPATLDWVGADRLYPAEWICRDTEEMAARILQLDSDPQKARAERSTNREHVQRRFSERVVCRALDELCGLGVQGPHA